ncbi:MAG: hypothetical protein AAGA46_00255 [Cyanobacteria bacterium P01_F01_bin.13]
MTAKYKLSRSSFSTVFAGFAIATMTFVMILNWQPWFNLAGVLVTQIDTGPLLGFLNWAVGTKAADLMGVALLISAIRYWKKKPVIAGSLAFCGCIALSSPSGIIGALSEIVGFLLWAWIQFVQMSPMLAEHSLIPKSAQWMKELRQYRVGAYVAEILVCFYKYPPYANGDLNQLMFDIQTFSISATKWSWGNFFSAAVVILCVEFVLVFLLKAATHCGVFSPVASQKTSQKGQDKKPGHKVYSA